MNTTDISVFASDPAAVKSFVAEATILFEPVMGAFRRVEPVKYLISFGLEPGYAPIKRCKYRNWLPLHDQKIVVLQRQEVTDD